MARRIPSLPSLSASTAVSLVVAGALFMLILDGTIMNTSLPQIGATLHVSGVDMNLGVTAYMLAVAVFTPLSGWTADRIGPKTVFASAIVVFTAASVACAFARSMEFFVVARVVQGIGGAMTIPVGRMVVLRNTKPAELMRATSLLTWPALLAPVVGPVIGGAITSTIGWRWNFLLNLPLGLLGVAAAMAVMPGGRDSARKPLDLVGAVMTGGALFLLLYGLDGLGQGRAVPRSGVLLALGLALGAAALRWLSRTRHPLIDLTTLKVRTFAISTLEGGNFCQTAVSATPFLIPLMLEIAWGLNPLQAGGWLLIYFLGNLLLKTVTTPILRMFGFRPLMAVTGLLIGLTIAACGFLTPATPHIVTALVLFAGGATRSMQMTAINTLTFADITAERRSSSATLSAVLQQLSMTAGVAVAAVLLNAAKFAHHAASPDQADFRLAFLVCGAAGALGGLLCLRLAPHAGAEVSGHQHSPRPVTEAARETQ